ALAARELADRLPLVGAAKIEARDIGARGHLEFADADDVESAGDIFPDALLGREHVARLVDVREMHRFADGDRPRVALLASAAHAKERRLAGAVRADDADDRARRYLERQLVDQQAIAIALGDVFELDNIMAQTPGQRNECLL